MNDYRSFRPEKSLLNKYRLQIVLVHLLVWLVPVLLTVLVTYLEDPAADELMIITRIVTWIIIPVLIISYYLAGHYYRSIRFEIVDDEIHVNRGIITKSRKIVPYRTITNIDIKRGPFDRVFGIGSVEIQTAGFSGGADGKSGPEERLDGVSDKELEAIQRLIINQMRRIRGSPGLSHDADEPVDVFAEMLLEIRELRKLVSNKLG